MTSEAFQESQRRVDLLWAPPPRLTVSEWADAHRYLSAEASAEPGKWQTERTPYLKGIMDAMNDPDVARVVFIKSAQIGSTEVLNNVAGYFMDQDPSPILVVQPTIEMGEAWSKDRLAPMIRDTPRLSGKVKDPRSRDANNTLLHKQFPGGHITIAGANAPSGLASRPIRVVLLDEVDRFPDSAGTEGDPVALATRRSDTFWNRKIFMGSTPTVRGASRIEDEWELSDKRRFFLPCPRCEFRQPLWFRDPKTKEYNRLIWDKNDDGRPILESIRYRCENCRGDIFQKEKVEMLASGLWVPTESGKGNGVAGFHINALYSPFRKWSEIVLEFWEKAHDREKLKTFVNTALGESFAEDGEEVSQDALKSHLEIYQAEVPAGAAVLVAAVDVQGNRLEAQIVGFGPGGESWLVSWERFDGSPAGEECWAELDAWLMRERIHESGAKMLPAITLIDSGDGSHTASVYKFVEPRQGARRRVFAIKGQDYLTRPGLAQESTSKKSKVRLFLLATVGTKDLLFSRMLKIHAPGPGYLHLPANMGGPPVEEGGEVNWNVDTYLGQLTAEKLVIEVDKRTKRAKKAYVKMQERNEALDLSVYCLAGLWILQNLLARHTYGDLEALLKTLQPAQTEAKPGDDQAQQTQNQPHGWVQGWGSAGPRGGGWSTNW